MLPPRMENQMEKKMEMKWKWDHIGFIGVT